MLQSDSPVHNPDHELTPPSIFKLILALILVYSSVVKPQESYFLIWSKLYFLGTYGLNRTRKPPTLTFAIMQAGDNILHTPDQTTLTTQRNQFCLLLVLGSFCLLHILDLCAFFRDYFTIFFSYFITWHFRMKGKYKCHPWLSVCLNDLIKASTSDMRCIPVL